MQQAEIDARLLRGTNPFEPVILPFDRTLEVPDVPEIHAAATEKLLRLVDQTRKDGKGRGVLLRGESGTGKTHLIRRVARRLSGKALFAAIDPIGDPARLARHILRRLVVELSATQERCGSLLRELAAGVLSEGIYAIPEGAAKSRLLDRIVEARSGFMQTDRTFALDCIEACSRALARRDPLLDLNVVKVLLKIWLEDQTSLARDWLRGVDLDDQERESLSVTRSLEREDDAENALRTLVSAARLFRPIVLCFDQTETLLSLGGETVVTALFRTLRRLEQLPGLVIVFTCLDDVWASKFEKIATAAQPPVLASGTVALHRLGPTEAKAIIAARLQSAYGDRVPPYPTYPVPEATIAALADLSPREMLELCARAFEAMRKAGRITEVAPPTTAPGGDDVQGLLEREWTEARQETVGTDTDAQTLTDGLAQLLRVAKAVRPKTWPGIAEVTREGGDPAVRVVLAEPGTAPRTMRLVASDTQNGTSLAKLLERLLAGTEKEGYGVTVLRLVEEKASWKVAAERLEELKGRGGRVVRPGDGVRHALAAVRRVMSRVAAGDVSSGAKRVTEADAHAFFGRQEALGKLLRALL